MREFVSKYKKLLIVIACVLVVAVGIIIFLAVRGSGRYSNIRYKADGTLQSIGVIAEDTMIPSRLYLTEYGTLRLDKYKRATGAVITSDGDEFESAELRDTSLYEAAFTSEDEAEEEPEATESADGDTGSAQSTEGDTTSDYVARQEIEYVGDVAGEGEYIEKHFTMDYGMYGVRYEFDVAIDEYGRTGPWAIKQHIYRSG